MNEKMAATGVALQTQRGGLLGVAAIYSVAGFAPPLAALAGTPVVTRVLAPEQYGRVAVALVIVQLSSMLVALGLPTAITRQAVMDDAGTGAARSTVVALIWISVAFASCALMVTGFCSRFGTACVAPTEQSLAIAAGSLLSLTAGVLAFLRGTSQPVTFVVLASSISFLGQGLALIGVVWWRDASGFASGLVLGYLAVAILAIALVVRGQRDRSHLRKQIGIGLPTVPHQLSFYLSTGFLVLITGRLIGLNDAGVLQVALLVGMAPSLLMNAFNNAWAPEIYRLAPDLRGGALSQIAGPLAWTMAAMSTSVALISPLVCGWLAPRTYPYLEMTRAAGVVAGASMLAVWYLTNAQLIFAAGRTAGLALITPVASIVGAGAAIALASSGSVTVVPLALVIFYLVLGLLVSRYAKRVTTIRWDEANLLLPLTLGATCAATSLLIGIDGQWLILRLLLAVSLVAGFGIYAFTKRRTRRR